MAFDINPFGFIGDLYKSGKMEKYYKLLVSCSLAAFVGFFGTLGVVGLSTLTSSGSILLALATGFFSACLMMAACVMLSVRKSGIWKDLSIVLPVDFNKTIEGADIAGNSGKTTT